MAIFSYAALKMPTQFTAVSGVIRQHTSADSTRKEYIRSVGVANWDTSVSTFSLYLCPAGAGTSTAIATAYRIYYGNLGSKESITLTYPTPGLVMDARYVRLAMSKTSGTTMTFYAMGGYEQDA